MSKSKLLVPGSCVTLYNLEISDYQKYPQGSWLFLAFPVNNDINLGQISINIPIERDALKSIRFDD